MNKDFSLMVWSGLLLFFAVASHFTTINFISILKKKMGFDVEIKVM